MARLNPGCRCLFPEQHIGQGPVDPTQGGIAYAGDSAKQSGVECLIAAVPSIVAALGRRGHDVAQASCRKTLKIRLVQRRRGFAEQFDAAQSTTTKRVQLLLSPALTDRSHGVGNVGRQWLRPAASCQADAPQADSGCAVAPLRGPAFPPSTSSAGQPPRCRS